MYQRMPWCIAPFVVSMFCIVQAATNAGLVRRFASVVFECIDGQHTIVVGLFSGGCPEPSVGNPRALGSSLILVVVTASPVLVSSLLVNCINNLPATVLWTKVLPELWYVSTRTPAAV
jgi:Na+/H+ antiporter NhaD/arsenite permease-like protein